MTSRVVFALGLLIAVLENRFNYEGGEFHDELEKVWKNNFQGRADISGGLLEQWYTHYNGVLCNEGSVTEALAYFKRQRKLLEDSKG